LPASRSGTGFSAQLDFLGDDARAAATASSNPVKICDDGNRADGDACGSACRKITAE